MQYEWAFLSLLCASAWAAAGDWNYSKTHFFGAGLTEWANAKVTTFDKVTRQDTVLADTLVSLGAPTNQVKLLLDKEASRAKMLRGLRRALRASREGDSLIFYFAGHGVQDPTGKTHFMPYDAKPNDPRYQSYWSVDSAIDEIAQKFRGDNVLVLVDACHAGAIVEAIRRQRSGIRFAAIASSAVYQSSTEDWTFTGAVVEGLQGFAGVDHNRDGSVTLKEIGRYARRELAFTDLQYSQDGARPNEMLRTTMAFSDLSGARAHPWVGRHVYVEFKGQWWEAKVREAERDRVLVRWYMEDRSLQQDWVTWDRIKPYHPPRLPRGTRVLAAKVPGVVLRSSYGLFKVRADDPSHRPRVFWVAQDSIEPIPVD